MFTSGVNARVNGHVPGLAGGQEPRSDQRKRKGKVLLGSNGPHISQLHPSAASHAASDSLFSGSCNGQQKFSDRLVGLRGLLQSNGDEAHQNRMDHAGLNDLEDPYTFNEPDPVRRYSSPAASSKGVSKSASRTSGKGKIERGSSSSTEPKGLNMTRLYPALFDPNSSQSTPVSSNNSSKTTLASLLESSTSDNLHPKRNDLERSFSSFSAKDLNCFPNLTSPPPPEQPSPPSSSIKVSPVKHGTPTTPQRESNKLAALFSPTYLNSIRHDKTKIRRISAPRNRDKMNSRTPSCEKRIAKDVTIKSAVVPSQDFRRQEDASKTTLSRLQDKIARKMVIGKHQRKMSTKSSGEVPPRRHSVNDLPIKKERSLLEEQLLGYKPSKPSKRDDVGVAMGYPTGLTPPPAATTRVPGVNGPLTYGIAKSIPNSQRSNGTAPRKEKPHATYGNQKSSKNQMSSPVLYGPGKTSSSVRHSANGSSLPSPRTHAKIEVNKLQKRPRTKQDLTGDLSKHGSLQQLQRSKESKSDVFTRTKVVETDSDDSEMEEGLVYQKHWFSGWMEAGSGLASEDKREGRLLQIRNEFRRKLSQVWGARQDPNASPLPKCIIEAALTKPSHTALLLSPNQPWHRSGRSKLSMLVPKQCVFGKHDEGELCSAPALPCAHHCVRHITYNVEQLLFEHCTAKYPDNTQCCVPVFDSSHELPLCSEHARKAADYNRQSQVLKPKRARKKSKPSAMTRSTKRNKKKKQKLSGSRQPSPVTTLSPSVSEILPTVQAQPRIQRSQSLPVDSLSCRDSEDHIDTGLHLESATSPEDNSDILVTDEAFVGLSETPMNVEELNGMAETIADVGEVDVGEEEALELAELPELADTGDLGQQDGSLLEEHDLTNVLNEIPTIAFTDFFEDKNGEPTREETEELDRALAAVDKSLQNMGSQILLDYKTQDLLQTTQTQAQTQVFLEVDKLSPGSQGLLDIDKFQAQGLFDEKNAQGLLDNFLDDQTLVQTLSAQLPTDLPGNSSGLVYYHNGYSVNGGGMDKNPCAANTSSSSLYQTPGMVGVPLPTQTDLHS